MPVSILIGYSHFKYFENNPNTNPPGFADNGGSKGVDNGMNLGIMVNPTIYFNDHIGIFFNVGYMGYSYKSISFSDNSDSNLNDNNNWKFSLKGNGFNIGGGLALKF